MSCPVYGCANFCYTNTEENAQFYTGPGRRAFVEFVRSLSLQAKHQRQIREIYNFNKILFYDLANSLS